ncbi:mediator complex subunit 13 C-terminal-domain-containing protein [Exophiala viscosa]|uniref:Mediator of RNA polymerase II transcription subunit 13 n=1 Tax=Exophiala viscosa TaxID=2486360 RepID=A0AAN6DP02_9EURO|nr:mediator complex subunit 13 C-terminal-domain-containing protein [Exophiala viscosa]
MANSLDFPYNCSTNVYTLNDFGEIAYIVCTVATPPTHDPSAFVSTPENTLARLRKTERQFREASILAALDVEARQLFTFYKKVDIANAKDQKTLLTKFGFVLRSNTCTIAYKTAARLPDLMKPEQAKLYRLFSTAIISSIKLFPTGDSALQAFGPNLYMVEQCPAGSEDEVLASPKRWDLHRIDLQIIPSGHIILTIAKERKQSFRQALDLEHDLQLAEHATSGNTPVYLAPVGRVARFVGSPNGYEVKSGPSDNQNSDARWELWRELLPTWMKTSLNNTVQVEDNFWIEAQIAVQEIERASTDDESKSVSSVNSANNASITWRTIFWPANLCFLLESKEPPALEVFGDNHDPMKFIQEWVAGVAQERTGDGQRQHELMNVAEEDDEPLFAENGTFDDPEPFQPSGPPAFPGNQSIYPTPPDVVMTHPTPGIASVEVMGMTPANLPGAQSDTVQQLDEEMHDVQEAHTSSELRAYYEEDLFEERPDDQFGREDTADEPNWDFFDQSGMETKPIATTDSNPPNGRSRQDDTAVSHVTYQTPQENGVQSTPVPSGRPAPEMHDAPLLMESPRVLNASHAVSPPRMAKSKTEVPVKSEQQHDAFAQTNPSGGDNDRKDRPNGSNTHRRYSIYNGVYPPAETKRDDRYAANGEFWFDPNKTTLQSGRDAHKLTAEVNRPQSSSNESDTSMESASGSEECSPTLNEPPRALRPWNEYHPQSPSVTTHHGELERTSVRQEIQELLGLLKPRSTQPPPIILSETQNTVTSLAQLTGEKFSQVANILVDQYSQTSLISHRQKDPNNEGTSDARTEVVADLSGINSSTNASTLAQLVSLKADHTKIRGRITNLQPDQICIRRGDQRLLASISILPFWNTLNLQPENGSKDVIAFCVHPAGEDVADGCSNLLQRMSDTYNSCLLGSHAIGLLKGVTSTGLVAWDAKSTSSISQICQKVGTAIGAADNLSGTALVYMVSQDDSPASYVEVCQAFHGLFESFAATADKRHISDIALQVVPRCFVASAESLVVPDQFAYIKLAIEVYNRLPPPEAKGSPAACDTAIVLSKVENNVHLQLASAYGSPLSEQGVILHVAYAITADNRWITAAWTDELGQVALTMSYCTRRGGSAKKRNRREIFREMWHVSHDLASKHRGRWRLAIVKHGYLDATEPSDWYDVFGSSTPAQQRCLPLILTVQLDPVYRIFGQLHQGKVGQSGLQNVYGTPASTPQGGITSPDQLMPATPTPGGTSVMNASTPPEPGIDPNVDGDLSLVNPAEESWGIILPYGVNQSKNMAELLPAGVTGLLVKRRGAKVEDGHLSIEVSLLDCTVHVGPDTSKEPSPDELLEDVIRQYRGLLTLGVTRGCIDPLTECLPWHIATVIWGCRALGSVM